MFVQPDIPVITVKSIPVAPHLATMAVSVHLTEVDSFALVHQDSVDLHATLPLVITVLA